MTGQDPRLVERRAAGLGERGVADLGERDTVEDLGGGPVRGPLAMCAEAVDRFSGMVQRFSSTTVSGATPRYREALFHLPVAQTSCFRFWGEGTWAINGRELCRRVSDGLTGCTEDDQNGKGVTQRRCMWRAEQNCGDPYSDSYSVESDVIRSRWGSPPERRYLSARQTLSCAVPARIQHVGFDWGSRGRKFKSCRPDFCKSCRAFGKQTGPASHRAARS